MQRLCLQRQAGLSSHAHTPSQEAQSSRSLLLEKRRAEMPSLGG